MRCRVCRERAAIEVRRHNAAFCRDHFIAHARRQVERTIHDHRMFDFQDRLAIAVSGGKDSLSLWDILGHLGYRAEGIYLDLGIEPYSQQSLGRVESFARERDLVLHTVSLEDSYGFTIPKAASNTRRTACSACGLSKRYVLNEEVTRRGFDVLVMGHNLDDEAATLFSNVLNWNTDYLGRQRPVLPSSNGLVRKVKPLVRIAERETAAYAVLSGIDYEVEECPLVAGNTVNRLKEWMARLERDAPGSTQHFFAGFLDRGAEAFGGGAPQLHPCAKCERPTTGEVCAFCRLQELAT